MSLRKAGQRLGRVSIRRFILNIRHKTSMLVDLMKIPF